MGQARCRVGGAPVIAVVGLAAATITAALGLAPATASAYTFGGGVAQAGPEQTVFDYSTTACDTLDIPDTTANAFRDSSGRVQLHSSVYTSRRFIGPSLTDLQHECRTLMKSQFDPDPANYQDAEWIGSTYTEDGDTIYALLTEEYQGWRHPGQCPAPFTYQNCWLNSVTLAVSTNAGLSYSHAGNAPSHLVATAPYQYIPGDGPSGYFEPSTIVKRPDGYYYSLMRVEQSGVQPEGSCLLRTNDLSQPASWRAWSGTGFSIRPHNPYTEPSEDPADHVCQRVAYQQINKMAGSLTFSTYFGKYLLVDVSFLKDPVTQITSSGFYYSLSDDLVNWTTRKRMLDAPLPWTYSCGDPEEPLLYGVVLDPDSPTRTFETTDQDAYMYFTRFHYTTNANGCFQTLDRDLVRVPIEFTSTGAAAAGASFRASSAAAPVGGEVTFDASSTRTVGDSSATYRWDLDGDGTFETDTGRRPMSSGSYARARKVRVRLRVTDELGESMETARTIRVIPCARRGRACRHGRDIR